MQRTLHIDPWYEYHDVEVGRSLVQKIQELVEQHFTEWHQVQDYAKELNVSPGYLNEVISAGIHKPAKEYILTRLILESKDYQFLLQKVSKRSDMTLGLKILLISASSLRLHWEFHIGV